MKLNAEAGAVNPYVLKRIRYYLRYNDKLTKVIRSHRWFWKILRQKYYSVIHEIDYQNLANSCA
jgi:hypothetical protein